jgi:hypothetical protein
MTTIIERILNRIRNLERQITVGPTPPANPREGDIWIDTSGL